LRNHATCVLPCACIYFFLDALWKVEVFEIVGDVGGIVYGLENEYAVCILNMRRGNLTPLLPDRWYGLFIRDSEGWLEERPGEFEALIRCEYS